MLPRRFALLVLAGVPAAPLARVHAGRPTGARAPGTQRPSGRSEMATPGEVIEIRSTGVELTYSVTTLHAKAGGTLTIRYDNIPEITPGPVNARVPLTKKLPDQVDASLGIVMAIEYTLQTVDGAALHHTIHKTVHRVPETPLGTIR